MYSEAPEIEKLATTVIDDEYVEYLPDVYGQPVRIKYLIKNSKKSQYLGKCSKATGKWKHLTNVDYVIEIWGPWWKNATTNEKKALLFHELCHIKMEEKEDEDGNIEIVWKLRKHDCEVFTDEITIFGVWRPELKILVDVCKEVN